MPAPSTISPTTPSSLPALQTSKNLSPPASPASKIIAAQTISEALNLTKSHPNTAIICLKSSAPYILKATTNLRQLPGTFHPVEFCIASTSSTSAPHIQALNNALHTLESSGQTALLASTHFPTTSTNTIRTLPKQTPIFIGSFLLLAIGTVILRQLKPATSHTGNTPPDSYAPLPRT